MVRKRSSAEAHGIAIQQANAKAQNRLKSMRDKFMEFPFLITTQNSIGCVLYAHHPTLWSPRLLSPVQQAAEHGQDFEEKGIFAAACELFADQHAAIIAACGRERLGDVIIQFSIQFSAEIMRKQVTTVDLT
jgi:hypothetical protein